MKKMILAGAVLASAMMAQSAIIFQDDFSGAGTATLNDSTTDIGGGTWVGGDGFKADGSIAGGVTTSATLAFAPASGNTYQLDARLDSTSADGNWLGIGFAKGQNADNDSNNNRFITGNTVGKAWSILKGDPTAANNGNTAFTSGATDGVVFPGSWEDETAAMDIRIVLDTQNATWNATWYAKLATESEYTVMRATTDLTAQDIDSVGIVAGDGAGQFDSFSLQTIPEPGTLGLIAISASALLFIRRRLAL